MHRTRYLIGLLTLVLSLVGAWFLWDLLGSADDHPGLQLRVDFRDARGLRPGADVRYRGVTVGTIRGVQVGSDGDKAVVELLLDPAGADQACVNSTFWIVSPRFSGITSGATGLDTLVRDAYVAFLTPSPRGSSLLPGSLIAGAERPPAALEPDSLEPLRHGDLLMSLLVPENHGLKPGSPVLFRGTTTGDVRSIDLAEDGTHVEVQLRIANRFRRTVTDQSVFWVARPYVSGALLSGFTVSDVNALVQPFVSYFSDPGQGVPVEDGYRVAATSERPDRDNSPVPSAALVQRNAEPEVQRDHLVLVRVVYAAIERDTFSADDPVQHEGTGVLYLDASGRAVVLTARSVVDGTYTESDTFGGGPDIAREQLKVVIPSGPVLRAHRVWVAPDGRDLAALVLDEAPPDLVGSPPAMLHFAAADLAAASVRAVRADGAAVAPAPLHWPDTVPDLDGYRGGALVRDERVGGLLGQTEAHANKAPAIVLLDAVPEDLRPGS
ncbi:MAG: MlaD family protein [Planctomycetota bacterium]